MDELLWQVQLLDFKLFLSDDLPVDFSLGYEALQVHKLIPKIS